MGTIEVESAKHTRQRKIKMLILGSIAVAGTLAVALTAPKAIEGMVKLGIIPKARQGEIYKLSTKALEKGRSSH